MRCVVIIDNPHLIIMPVDTVPSDRVITKIQKIACFGEIFTLMGPYTLMHRAERQMDL